MQGSRPLDIPEALAASALPQVHKVLSTRGLSIETTSHANS
jgi:hypothetical protein